MKVKFNNPFNSLWRKIGNLRHLPTVGKITAVVIVLWSVLEISFRLAVQNVDYSAIFRTDKIEKRTSTDYIVVHHTAINSDSTSILGIHEFHKFDEQHKWKTGIAYHYLLMKGVCYKLHSDFDATAHAYSFNRNSIAVCAQQNYSENYVELKSYWQIATICTLLRRKWAVDIDHIIGHSECHGKNCTDCPGTHFDMNILRRLIWIQNILI